MQRHIMLGVMGGMMIAWATVAVAGNAVKEQQALRAAEAWLAGVDKGDYAAGWKQAAGYLRGAVTRKQFVQALEAARKPLGKTLSRKVESATYMTSLPGAPDGEYVVIVFKTSFANKKAGIETITPMLDKDGRWRVSGYYIR
ncbi:MAG: DUF4019 domain-containing protein [Kiritimatiellae bacterium]|nr:DUF4019 domain-containing protein [Kiritimatiellia bacterium]